MTAQQPDNELNIQSEITNFVIDALGGIDNIEQVEESDGSMWILLKDGLRKSIMVHDCELEGANLD